MKHILHFLIFLISLCSGLSAKQIDVSTAGSIAKTFIKENIFLRSAKEVSLNLIYTAENKKRTTDANVYYYIFNIGNNQGFIIVSADDVNTPILGYSHTGSYDPNNLPDNFKFWMNSIALGMEAAISKKSISTKEIQTEWENFRNGKSIYSKSTTRAVIVNPLIKTTWNQLGPYNSLIPYFKFTNRLCSYSYSPDYEIL